MVVKPDVLVLASAAIVYGSIPTKINENERCIGLICRATYCHVARYKFEIYLDQIGIDLEGSILDVACGPVSLASLYDGVHGHDNSPAFIRRLAEQGVSARLADITQLDYPPNSFRYVVTFNPPMRPFRQRGAVRAGIKRFVEEMLHIAQEKVVIRSGPMMPHLPPEYDTLVERRGENYVVYRAGNWPGGPVCGEQRDSLYPASV